MSAHPSPGTLSVILWRADNGREQWAVVCWQDGPMLYRMLEVHESKPLAEIARNNMVLRDLKQKRAA